MRYTTNYPTACSVITLLCTGLTPCLASDAPETPQTPTDAPVVDTAEDAAVAAPATPNDIMDRSGWPVIVVTPADGKVTHNPHYMGDVPMGDDIVSPLHAPDPVWQIQEALRGADAGNWNGENLADLGTQPFIALAQFVAIPFRAVIEHPWSQDTSPK